MAQLIDPPPSDEPDTILCCYVNATSKIQIARVSNVPNWYFERVVFPGQRLLFEAVPTAMLEIHTGMMASAILSDTIPCLQLSLETVEQLDAATASRLAAESATASAAMSATESAANSEAPESPSAGSLSAGKNAPTAKLTEPIALGKSVTKGSAKSASGELMGAIPL